MRENNSATLQQQRCTRIVQRVFTNVAVNYDAHAEVFRQTGERLLQRLEVLARRPDRVLDLGCGSGHLIASLRKIFPKAQIAGVDVSASMLQQVGRRSGWWRKAWLIGGDAHSIPLADASVDLVVSNQLLPWCLDPQRVFQEIYRVLTPEGAVFFTTAGPDTLIEYRSLLQNAVSERHDSGLVDMHLLGDAMLSVGFSAPVLDRENIDVSYPSVSALRNELWCTGVINRLNTRLPQGLFAGESRTSSRSAADSPISITLELVQGHGWKGELPAAQHSADGTYQVSFDTLRRELRRK